MKIRFTQLLTVIAIGVMFLSSFQNSNSAVTKRVLLEQHTGAWCGWCPDGTVKMDECIKKYGDKFIGVKMHNGDAMATVEEQEVGATMGIQGYPSGTISREWFNNGQGGVVAFLDRGNWDAATAAVLQSAAPVDVVCKYTIDPTTRELTAYLDATFASSISNETRFNLIVCEDKVTGSGSGYNQQNYLSGRAGYESNPYYKLPSVITGYEHNKVARKYLGGTWGQEGSIAASANSGSKWSYKFTYSIPSSYNIDNIWCVGFVQNYDPTNSKYQILNAITGTKVALTTQLEPIDMTYQAKNNGELGELGINLKNISAGNITYSWKLDKSTRTPADWTAELEGATGDVAVNAGSYSTLKIKLTPGATKGIGDATLKVWDKAQPTGLSFTQKLTIISNEIEKFQILDDGSTSLKAELTNSGITDFYEVPSVDFVNCFDNLSNIKTVIWTGGEEGTIAANEANTISSLMANGKGVLLTGALLANSMNVSAKGVLSTLGVTYDNVCRQGASTQGNINLKGYTDDPITDGFSQPCVLKKYLTFSIKASNQQVAAPILKHANYDTVIATRAQLSESRAVFLAINPAIIGNNVARNGIIKKSLDWLAAGAQQTGSQIALNMTEMQYDKVNVGESKTKKFRITNEGNADLVISEITNDYQKDVNKVFTLTNLDTPPYTIAPGGEMEVSVKFTPTKKQFFEGDIVIKSNSLKNPDEIINLYGEGNLVESVNDEAVSMTGLFRMSATPNPATTNSVISFTLNGNAAQNLELVVMDNNGKQISSIFNSSITPGTQTLNFATTDFVTGNYHLVAKIAGEMIQLPLIIIK